MSNILISAPFGLGSACLKTLTLANKNMDQNIGTCHDSWHITNTVHGDTILARHTPNIKDAEANLNMQFDMTVWMRINEKNLEQICQRIVVLDFLYSDDPGFVNDGGAWNIDKHNRIKGDTWPEFSKNITDYPQWCLDEICQTAYYRCEPWVSDNNKFDFQIDSDELFGDAEPVTIKTWLGALGCEFDVEFLNQWKAKQRDTYLKYKDLFGWHNGKLNEFERSSTPGYF